MKQFTLLAACLTALLSGVASAHPGHGVAAAVHVMESRAALNATTGQVQNGTNQAAQDNIPVFKTPTCVCPPVVCDSRMNTKSQCQCQSQNQLACHIKSQGGCPKPADNACD